MRKVRNTPRKVLPSFSKLQREAISIFNSPQLIKKGSTHSVRSSKFDNVKYIFNFCKIDNPKNYIAIIYDNVIDHVEVFKRVDFRYNSK